jgi:hypothetical protein
MRNSFNDLKPELTENDIDEILAIVGKGCRDNTKKRLRSILTYGRSTIPSYGIFNRLCKESHGWDYCAGQSYTDEIRTLRECILKG